jgi:maleate isomerase
MPPPAFAPDRWGARARFGLFIVGAEVVPEAEWTAMAPDGVSLHAARVSAPAPWAPWRADRSGVDLSDDLARGAAWFSAARLSAVVLAHSTSSVVGGEGWDDAACARVAEALPPGTQVTTNGRDCTLALRASGVRRPFVVLPPWFGDPALDAARTYFAAEGFAPAALFRHVPEARWADVPPGRLYAEGMQVEQRLDLLHDQILAECPADADGVLLVGTGLRCVGAIAPLEAALGRPVVTANQASLWRCLALTGVDAAPTGYGALFALRP